MPKINQIYFGIWFKLLKKKHIFKFFTNQKKGLSLFDFRDKLKMESDEKTLISRHSKSPKKF